jgi:hypothetical protein
VSAAARLVASAIAKNPLAIHCAAPMASAVPDEPAERLWTMPAAKAATR